MAADDPLAFPMKVRSLAAGRYGMWRGGKDLFFQWAADHTAGWLADRDAYMTQQGDQHPGNIGTYLAAGPLGTLGFGMVDFDDSHRLPFQFELLQGVVSMRLIAAENGIELTDAQTGQLIDTLLAEYRAAAGAEAVAVESLAGEPVVRKLLATPAKQDFEKELKDFTDGAGGFVAARVTKKGVVKDVLRPVGDEATDALAAGIAQAIARSPEQAKLFRVTDAAGVRKAIHDVALRTRSGSSGSQGLKKYFVLMDRPLVGVDHDAVLYVKQQIPTAAERSGIIPTDPRPPGRRCAEDTLRLSRPRPLFSGWCQIGEESYWVMIREPWTKELDPEDVKTFNDLLRTARIWAVAAGAGHREPGQAQAIASRITPALASDLRRLSGMYLDRLDADWRDLTADPRTAPLIAVAERALEDARTRAADGTPHRNGSPASARSGGAAGAAPVPAEVVGLGE